MLSLVHVITDAAHRVTDMGPLKDQRLSQSHIPATVSSCSTIGECPPFPGINVLHRKGMFYARRAYSSQRVLCVVAFIHDYRSIFMSLARLLAASVRFSVAYFITKLSISSATSQSEKEFQIFRIAEFLHSAE